ncbi:cyclopropane-fatty-acyl-phospholipid synthase family protein [Desulfobacula sp.]|uniref:SAM-dependent methyltransferase n=1 Tax=Desulfobacula sp. TaxID=2593537 RepID=UPI0026211314|nr:cyclopropane-fatty-acyl-phospholipid synthase family protein [Desulfobacula sp.]
MKPIVKKESFFLKKFIQTLNQEMVPLEIIDINGNKYSTAQQDIKHKILIKDRKFFKALISPDAFSLGEAYVKGYFDISGSIKELYELVCDKLLNSDQRKRRLTFCSNFFMKAKEKEKENIEYHYNVPSDFYQLFLGETMGYTCGYYVSENATMDNAQNEKMDIICRKLRLKNGEKLLDIGCGWGNFAVYAAKHYNVSVTGITLSSEQKNYAEKWIENQGLSHKINIKILNYRDLGSDIFDKISCVGMSEHVGKSNMLNFFKIVHKSLKKGGLFMQHTITTNTRRKKGYENSFLNKYMFPGGELMFEHDLVNLASSSGFELLNAENFRTHYIKTLNDWIVRMEKRKDKILKLVSDNVYRIYHIFFIGSLISFRQKEISLFQNLFYKTDIDNSSTDTFLSPYSKNETRIA